MFALLSHVDQLTDWKSKFRFSLSDNDTVLKRLHLVCLDRL